MRRVPIKNVVLGQFFLHELSDKKIKDHAEA